MKRFLFRLVAGLFVAVAVYAQDKKPPTPTTSAPAPQPAQDAAYYSVYRQGKWVGTEKTVVTPVTYEGRALLKHFYECQVTAEAGLKLTSARGECLFVAENSLLTHGTLTVFDEDETVVDSELVCKDNKLQTRPIGFDDAPKETPLPGNTPVVTSWMVEQMILAHKPLEAGLKITYVEFTGDPDRPLRDVAISIVARQRRTVSETEVEGWQAELTYPSSNQAITVQLFLDPQGKILERVYGEVIFTRVAGDAEMQPARTYEFAQRGRRDPFVARRVKLDTKKPRDEDDTTQEGGLTLLDAQKLVEAAKKDLADMKRLAVELKDQTERDNKLGELYRHIDDVREQLGQTRYEQEQKTVAGVVEEAKRVFSDDVRLLQDAKLIHVRAQRHFDSEMYEKLSGEKKNIEDIMGKPAVRGNPRLEKEIREMAIAVAKLGERGIIRLDFNAKKLKVTGIVFSVRPAPEEVCFTFSLLGKNLTTRTNLLKLQSDSEAVVAGPGGAEEVICEGGEVKIIKDSGITIQRIDPGAVIFLYKTESIRLALMR